MFQDYKKNATYEKKYFYLPNLYSKIKIIEIHLKTNISYNEL